MVKALWRLSAKGLRYGVLSLDLRIDDGEDLLLLLLCVLGHLLGLGQDGVGSGTVLERSSVDADVEPCAEHC